MAMTAGDSWLAKGANILLFGPPGGGKSHLAAAIGLALIENCEHRWSLQTSDPKVAAKRRAAGKERAIADLHGDGSRDFVEVMEAWSRWISKQVSPKTTKRYACSLAQLAPYLDGKSLSAVDGHAAAAIVLPTAAFSVEVDVGPGGVRVGTGHYHHHDRYEGGGPRYYNPCEHMFLLQSLRR
jgi:energy-coupling factor transporter ATP-binding protein EcfA2